MSKVGFTRMSKGVAADFDLIAAEDEAYARELPDRVLAHLSLQAVDDGAYQIDRLQHLLQSATRAERDGADDDWVAAALLHDIGDVLAPFSHGEIAATILRPFVRPEVEWVVRQHGTFQRVYYANLPPGERYARERLRGHPWYERAVEFCADWDQCSFDPDYDIHSIEHFEPLLRRVLTRTPRRA